MSPLPNPNIKQAEASVNGVLISGISDKNIKAIDNKHQKHPKRENRSRPSQLEYLLLTIFPIIYPTLVKENQSPKSVGEAPKRSNW